MPKRAPSYATEAGSHELAQPDLRKEGSSLEAVPVMTQPVEVYREAQMPRVSNHSTAGSGKGRWWAMTERQWLDGQDSGLSEDLTE